MPASASVLKAILEFLKDLGWLIAYVSLILSLLSLYFARFRPFAANPSFGGINLIPSPGEEGRLKLMLGVPVTFYNDGARPGTITDLAMKVERVGDQRFQLIYFPAMMYDTIELLKTKLAKTPDLNAMRANFSGLQLPPGQQINTEILFYLEPPRSQLTLLPGKYSFSFYTKVNRGGYDLQLTRIEEITQTTIDELGTGTIVVLLPFPEREQFVRSQTGNSSS